MSTAAPTDTCWTVTVPTAETAQAVATPGVDVEVWNLTDPLPQHLADRRLDLVLVPHYFFSRVGWQHCKDTPSIQALQLPSAGFEHALPFLNEHVTLLNGRGIHDEETAELALGLVLTSLRGIDTAIRNMPDGAWINTERRSLVDRTAIVVGAGAVGTQIARLLMACGVTVTLVAQHERTVTIGSTTLTTHTQNALPKLAATTDILVLAVPLSPTTHHLVDAKLLAALPDQALVVNVARGGVVDTEALLKELTDGRLYAALDVTDPEPLPSDHPLWHAPNLIITPHVGGNTTATYSRTEALMRRQIAHLVAHEPFENIVQLAPTAQSINTVHSENTVQADRLQ